MLQQLVDSMRRNLTPQEMQRLDELITPELASLVSKGAPELAPIFQPFVQNDAPDPMNPVPGSMPMQPGPAMRSSLNGMTRSAPGPEEFVPETQGGPAAFMNAKLKPM